MERLLFQINAVLFNSESRKIDLKDHVMLKTSVIAAENADQTRINDNILK